MRLLAAFALAACAAGAQAFSGVVTHVTDGDTVWVQPDAADSRHRKPIKLRLQGIDAPERCQAWGAQAAAALASRVWQQRVEVRTRAKDSYDRVLGNLRLDGEDVSAWMVEHGHAWSYRYRHSGGPYAAQQRQASAARRGLFADPEAIEPRLFRKRHGPCN
ncbi:thermonuclease family protein [Piscinibacter sp.]|uniref:thermonuclease family protein n=1 Tax=Piscinibacter sp. TaxID=1903157 RepID=UPI00355A3ECE